MKLIGWSLMFIAVCILDATLRNHGFSWPKTIGLSFLFVVYATGVRCTDQAEEN